MRYDHDLICIGLGPAGMAVSIMGSAMGLNVCAIEKQAIGGECMNVGCIPSKSLLRMAKARNIFTKLDKMELYSTPAPGIKDPFTRIHDYITYINDKKTTKMFDKVKLYLGKGSASFVDSHTVLIGDKKITAKRIYIATGTSPMVPPIPGIKNIDIITNMNVFSLSKIPESMTIIGGGAIGSEIAQAFSRLGCKCSIVQMDPYLVPIGDEEAGKLLEEVFIKEGIEVFNNQKITKVEQEKNKVALYTEDGKKIVSERLMVAAGRKINTQSLKLENVGVKLTKRGAIEVNSKLQTSAKHIYAVGDVNGHIQLSHAAMHQGMLALMNAMSPLAIFKYKNYQTPWTVFTEPQISYVGMSEQALKDKGIKYQTIKVNYGDYGAAIAEDVGIGFVKAFVSYFGRIYGVSIVGEGSGEMINEWALAIQKKIRLHDIMFLQHSFPTMGFLTKRVSEEWMMKKMEASWMKKMCKLAFNIF